MSLSDKHMKVLITGANGQLGYALQKTAPAVIGAGKMLLQLIPVARTEFDLAQPESLLARLDTYQPDAIINAAAYTAVDKAEANQELAQCINATAVSVIAQWCEQKKIPLIQVSTDFVFDGKKSSPYQPDDKTNPLGVYAQTKLAGELAALENCSTSYIVRTGWVYCEHGANFVKTMLRLAAERETLGVVADQVGTPTYAIHLAQMIWQLLVQRPTQKIFHCSDAGVASWYDFAVAIFAEAKAVGLLEKVPHVKPIATSDYPTPAQRPFYSVLDKQITWSILGISPCHWQSAVASMLAAYKKQQI
ncbi:dTDP-4-dehydrorhamnose reductase [Cellvibrio fibrivorans]|uniref:dTDP-4-dehydrorhamnose reductase n=1 Tax=Cellvibrio fibrivorans TaxID=126350 RepID=A0ABU1UU84_9GAMM|nr:dTDP-4-dehydrorhamnose reductase [Cellvibrio fibrivorans]MDR7088693.1 dTDP-4-dehydrorhamnose reductase [Cellvibrio fibrivorans]